MHNVWYNVAPDNPVPGDCIQDITTGKEYRWSGDKWIEMVYNDHTTKFDVPTEEQLSKYPALKSVWEEFLLVWKTIGVGKL